MLPLITLLYFCIFPLKKPVEILSCKHKLEKINYTFKYNDDPSYCRAAYYRYGACYCKDGHKVNKPFVKKIISYYKCFNHALEMDTSKVLLITHQAKRPVRNKILNSAINCYDLNVDKTYFTYDSLATKEVKVELLDENHSKLKAKNILSKEAIKKALDLCTLCQF